MIPGHENFGWDLPPGVGIRDFCDNEVHPETDEEYEARKRRTLRRIEAANRLAAQKERPRAEEKAA